MKKRLVYLMLILAAAAFVLQGCERKNSSGYAQDRGRYQWMQILLLRLMRSWPPEAK